MIRIGIYRIFYFKDIDEIKDEANMCTECRICIDKMYEFRETCLNNNVKLWENIKKIRDNEDSELTDVLSDTETQNSKRSDIEKIRKLFLS